ncbi:MAG: HAD-IC family P-type ATPase, partial [Synergistes sp.]|nr:HAD-IC family P-type ATPase [Synergistes sp.]
KMGILFKGGSSLEAIKNVAAVVMDKTGTITKGDFALQRAVPAGNISKVELISICASCELNSTHPIGSSIVAGAREKGIEINRPEKVEEIAGKGVRAVLPQGIALCGSRKLMAQFGVDCSSFSPETTGTEVLAALNGEFIGHLVISDTIKEESPEAIRDLKALGIKTVMLTGDGEASALSVAEEVGIDEVYAKLMPQDKLTELQRIRNREGAVMFVGDGINDAPVLAGADVGAAMGSGADAAIEAADVVFMNSSLVCVPISISIARMATKVAVQNVVFALIVKLMVMVLGLLGMASMWFAVFADSGVAAICVINSIRVLHHFRKDDKTK